MAYRISSGNFFYVPWVRTGTGVSVSFWMKGEEEGNFQFEMGNTTSDALIVCGVNIISQGESVSSYAVSASGLTFRDLLYNSQPEGGESPSLGLYSNPWNHFCFFFSTSTSVGLRLHVNGSELLATSGVGSPVSPTDNLYLSSATEGTVAELAVWNSFVGTTISQPLSRRFAPPLVRNTAPGICLPLVRDTSLTCLSGATVPPVNLIGTTVPAPHPPAIY